MGPIKKEELSFYYLFNYADMRRGGPWWALYLLKSETPKSKTSSGNTFTDITILQ